MGRSGWGLLATALLALAACSGSNKGSGTGNGPTGPTGPEECPAGTVREGDRCLVACPGGSRCGDVCCGAGSVCAAPNQCVATQGCGPGLPECPAGEGCLTGGRCAARDLSCTWKPPAGEFNPRIAWRWTGSTSLPQYQHVLSTPVVVPLTRQPTDAFAAPAVVFAAGVGDVGAGTQVPAVLRAVSGLGGAELWTSDPAHPVNALSGVAAGDLDGDGTTEFVAARLPEGPNGGDPATEGLVAFGHDGRFLWDVKLPGVPGGPAGARSVYWGAPSIGNLTGGREANVVIGATVLDAHGNVVCRGAAGQGANSLGPISVLADVDLDGKLDIVTGNTVYGADCQPKAGWPNGRPDGLVAIADISGDAHPEIVVVSAGTVRMQDWRGAVLWGPVAIPPGGGVGGGAPTIADFDGDGQLEIGVAGRSSYTVFKTTGAVLWSRPTQDDSAVTGSSVFDFQRDGRAEVVYGDECYTRVYDGQTGATVFQGKNPSCTVHENPVIADVDRDGRAEIVVGTNSVCATQCEWEPGVFTSHFGSGLHGITVFKDLRDLWVGTRPIWNQHAYHVTNVSDDGSIPVQEQTHWTDPATNMFRANPVGNPDYSAPDLAAELRDVGLSTAACPQTLRISVRVWNRGAVLVSQGVPISVYAGPASGAPAATVRTASAILPGASEVVTIDVPGPPAAQDYTIVVNDDGTGEGVVGECDRANNAVPLSQLRCTAVNN